MSFLCKIFGHKFKIFTNEDTKEVYNYCVRCGFKENFLLISVPKDEEKEEPYSKLLNKAITEIKGKEQQILDDYVKAYICSEVLDGKDLIGVLKNYTLVINHRLNGTSYHLETHLERSEKMKEEKVTCAICGKECQLKDVFTTWITGDQKYYICSKACFDNRLKE